MVSNIFVNLPVQNLPASKEFFTKLGFTFNAQFTDENAACLVVSDTIYAMLVTHERFKGFTKKQISDAKTSTEMLLALQVGSREEVDAILEKAFDAGATSYIEPQDHGWMYARNFADPDGHQWEIFFMDSTNVPR